MGTLLPPLPIGAVEEDDPEGRVYSWDPLPDHLHRVIVEFSPIVAPHLFGCYQIIGNGAQILALSRIVDEGRRLGNVFVQTSVLAEEEDGMSLTDGLSMDRTIMILPAPHNVDPEFLGRYNGTRFRLTKEEWMERSTGRGKGCWF